MMTKGQYRIAHTLKNRNSVEYSAKKSWAKKLKQSIRIEQN